MVLKYLYEFPKELINGVIFGAKIEQLQKEKIIKLMNDNEYVDVDFYQATLDPNNYGINIIKYE